MLCRFYSRLGNAPVALADRSNVKELPKAIRHGGSFWAEEDGPATTEYAVLLVLIVFGVFAALILIGMFLKNTFTNVTNGLPES